MQLTDKSIEQGCFGKNGAGNFKYFLTSNEGSVLNQGEFNAELIFTDSPGKEKINGETYENTGNFFLKIPFNENAEKLEVVKERNTIAQINLANLGSRPCKIWKQKKVYQI